MSVTLASKGMGGSKEEEAAPQKWEKLWMEKSPVLLIS